MEREMIYLDNAATSFPKPREVLQQMVENYARLGVIPGRGSYDLAMEAAELVFQARQKLARFFGAPIRRVIFTANATDALNMAIQGLITQAIMSSLHVLNITPFFGPYTILKSGGGLNAILSVSTETGVSIQTK